VQGVTERLHPAGNVIGRCDALCHAGSLGIALLSVDAIGDLSLVGMAQAWLVQQQPGAMIGLYRGRCAPASVVRCGRHRVLQTSTW
jgi:hypothetical protein